MPIVTKHLSLEEFLELPETKPPIEYLDGRIHRKVSPKAKHGRLQVKLAQKLNDLAEPVRRAAAFSEVRFSFAGRSIVPDVALVAWARIPRDPSGEVADDFLFAPDLAAEILSPRQSLRRTEEKLAWCVRHGVKIGWLIDPRRKQVTVFRPGKPPEVLTTGPIDAGRLFTKDVLSVEEVFGWLVLPR